MGSRIPINAVRITATMVCRTMNQQKTQMLELRKYGQCRNTRQPVSIPSCQHLDILAGEMMWRYPGFSNSKERLPAATGTRPPRATFNDRISMRRSQKGFAGEHRLGRYADDMSFLCGSCSSPSNNVVVIRRNEVCWEVSGWWKGYLIFLGGVLGIRWLNLVLVSCNLLNMVSSIDV